MWFILKSSHSFVFNEFMTKITVSEIPRYEGTALLEFISHVLFRPTFVSCVINFENYFQEHLA